ncbi:uncharacterized protein LOC109854958 isoform X2 [Pseudomyrmex gracilis]|nr:uncharacterized protein LOC109854958 isoform X2 [Pseudomyrmex gracilis]
MDVIEKFSAISSMIQERFNKVTDCEQSKHCGDVIEQLKFLVEEPRGQRFVVNINVPSQSNAQTSNGLPVLACNMRKRRHSNSERIKRVKSQSNLEQQMDPVTSPPSCHNVDATPLESLPGNIDLFKQTECESVEKIDGNVAQEFREQCDFDKINITNATAIGCNRSSNARMNTGACDISEPNGIASVGSCEMEVERKKEQLCTVPARYTTATSTEELLTFASTEVQTTPYSEIPESESESNDEPIENLSILTKEILNRTELQECIAENINKAIVPTDLSFKDENLNESVGEGNTSFMAELNTTAIYKSIVEATESDPVFEKFLNEFIRPYTETDTSPEEDGVEGKSSPKSSIAQKKQTETGVSNVVDLNTLERDSSAIADTGISGENDEAPDVPLKHRLRSSSRQQCNKIEDEDQDKTKDREREQSSVLEDQNAAAVLSIINANINNNGSGKKTFDDAKQSIIANNNNGNEQKTQIAQPDRAINKTDVPNPATLADIRNVNSALPASSTVQSKAKKTMVKRPRSTKSKRDRAIDNNNLAITEHEIMTMPTLIVCSKEEVKMNHFVVKSAPTSRFIPIAPKESSSGTVETVYLKAVNVAQKVPRVGTTLPATVVAEEPKNSIIQLFRGEKDGVNKQLKSTQKIETTMPTVDILNQQIPNCHSVESMRTDCKIVGGESITLYGNDETSAKTSLDNTNMPMINLEENISLSESGFSPYLKFSCSKTSQSHNLSDIDLAPVIESVKSSATADNNNRTTDAQLLPANNADIITKRTPKSLLKSRSKNHRLSLSTPRKRSSHIRALDFGTPTSTPVRVLSSVAKTNGDENAQFSSASTKRLKSVCRTSLFRSPSLSGTSRKQKSPLKVCQSYRIPIATRSPAPKLMGGWDKYNGVGVIIGDASPRGSTSASCSSLEDRNVQRKVSKIVGSWDADLRKGIQMNIAKETEIKKSARKRKVLNKGNGTVEIKTKYNRSARNKCKKKICEINKVSDNDDVERIGESKERISERYLKNAASEKNFASVATELRSNEMEEINVTNLTANRSEKISPTGDNCEAVRVSNTNALKHNIVEEKKPVKKYAQLTTITTNIRKSDIKRDNREEDTQISEISRLLSADSVARLPDMISLETPKKLDNIGPPPTPRVLSPSSGTPFVKVSEDSGRLRSFIPTPEFPITPGINLTPKEETTRDIVKRDEYNSPYYKPTSEQTPNSDSSIVSKSVRESPVISSSHIKIHSTRNNFASLNTYQTCTSKLEITQFEVIKENLPREEAIKELKISSTSKDSASTPELNTPNVVVDDHHRVDLVEINEFKDVSEHCEKIIDNNYVVADVRNDSHNESALSNISLSTTSSSSSSSSSTSSSSSSSSSTTSNNSTVGTCSDTLQVEKCEKISRKTSHANTSNDSAENNIVKTVNDVNFQTNTDKTSNNDVLIESETSPKKVFAIAKTDEQIEATMKETPAKNEILLNEDDISETPSSSKSGVENLTNLSIKISAIMTEEEKRSKLSKQSKTNVYNKIQINKLKPKIINIQRIRRGSVIIGEPARPVHQFEQNSLTYNQTLQRQQLEEKRQRMIAKIKDNSTFNHPSVPKHKRVMMRKTSDNFKRSAQFGRRQRNVQLMAHKYSRKTSINRNVNKKNTDLEDHKKQKASTRERYTVRNLVEECENEEEMKNRVQSVESKRTNKLKNSDDNSNEPLDNQTTKQLYNNHISRVENDAIKNNNKSDEFTQSHNSNDPDCVKEKSDSKENAKESCYFEDNIAKEEIADSVEANNMRIKEGRVTGKEKNFEKHVVVQEKTVLDKTKKEMHNQIEAHKAKQFANITDKSESCMILRYKVDLVKRDLFSDGEENDHKISLDVNTKDDKTRKITKSEPRNQDFVEISTERENVNSENIKQELSMNNYLQCLQLVPANKSEHFHNEFENEQEHGETQQNKHEQVDRQNEERIKENKNQTCDESRHQTVDSPNYKAEYHFVYDDNVPMRKRRRRYSGHDLQIKINYADLSDSNPVECIKVMKATEFQEIFNLSPKLSKKRTMNKKSNVQNEKDYKTCDFQTDKDAIVLKDIVAKPLATSSPTDVPSKAKVKKVIVKTAATNKADNINSDANKKQVFGGYQEKEITVKNRKRKLSETKEIKQIEKKPCTTDPQTLLSNLDSIRLDKFLDTVHGRKA